METPENTNTLTEKELQSVQNLEHKIHERTYLTSKEFWFGLALGLITMNTIFALIGA